MPKIYKQLQDIKIGNHLETLDFDGHTPELYIILDLKKDQESIKLDDKRVLYTDNKNIIVVAKRMANQSILVETVINSINIEVYKNQIISHYLPEGEE